MAGEDLFYTGDLPLDDSQVPGSALNAPQSQPSFDTAGTPAGSAKDVLTSGRQVVTTIGNAITGIFGAVKDVGTNAAIEDSRRRLALQQSNTAAQVADYQNRTALAQAKDAYLKAAGVVQSNPLLWLAGGAALLFAFTKWKR